MAPVFQFSFKMWLKHHAIFFYDNDVNKCGPRTVYGIHDGTPEMREIARKHGPLEFRPVAQSDKLILDLARTRWTTFKRNLDFVRHLVTERAPAEDQLDHELDMVHALNCGIEVRHEPHPPTYRGPEHHRAEFRAFIQDLCMSHPPLLEAAIKMCKLCVCKAHYRAYLQEYSERLLDRQRRGYMTATGPDEYPDLPEEPVLQFLLQSTDQNDANFPKYMRMDNVLGCASNGRYTQAGMYFPAETPGAFSNTFEISGAPRIEAQPGQGIFIPCNVQYERKLFDTTYLLHMEAKHMDDPLENQFYFKPLTITLSELCALQRHVAHSLARVRQNVPSATIPTTASKVNSCYFVDCARTKT